MKIKLVEVKNRHQALCMLGSKKLPIKLSYAVGKNILKLQEELDAIEKARIKLVEQYAEKDESGACKMQDGHYDVGDNEQKLNEEYAEFLKTETDITVYTVPEELLDTLEDAKYDALTPAELIALDFMLEHPAPVPEAKPRKTKSSGKKA